MMFDDFKNIMRLTGLLEELDFPKDGNLGELLELELARLRVLFWENIDRTATTYKHEHHASSYLEHVVHEQERDRVKALLDEAINVYSLRVQQVLDGLKARKAAGKTGGM
jgi:hypothetical protein